MKTCQLLPLAKCTDALAFVHGKNSTGDIVPPTQEVTEQGREGAEKVAGGREHTVLCQPLTIPSVVTLPCTPDP